MKTKRTGFDQPLPVSSSVVLSLDTSLESIPLSEDLEPPLPRAGDTGGSGGSAKIRSSVGGSFSICPSADALLVSFGGTLLLSSPLVKEASDHMTCIDFFPAAGLVLAERILQLKQQEQDGAMLCSLAMAVNRNRKLIIKRTATAIVKEKHQSSSGSLSIGSSS